MEGIAHGHRERISEAGGELAVARRDGGRDGRGDEVRLREVAELDEMRRVVPGAAAERGIGRGAPVQQAEGDLKRRGLGGVGPGDHFIQPQIEFEREVIALGHDVPQRTGEEAVRARRIPCDIERAVRGVPADQRCITVPSPTARERVGGESLREARRPAGQGGEL